LPANAAVETHTPAIGNAAITTSDGVPSSKWRATVGAKPSICMAKAPHDLIGWCRMRSVKAMYSDTKSAGEVWWDMMQMRCRPMVAATSVDDVGCGWGLDAED
jgi:hypothetical protein